MKVSKMVSGSVFIGTHMSTELKMSDGDALG